MRLPWELVTAVFAEADTATKCRLAQALPPLRSVPLDYHYICGGDNAPVLNLFHHVHCHVSIAGYDQLYLRDLDHDHVESLAVEVGNQPRRYYFDDVAFKVVEFTMVASPPPPQLHEIVPYSQFSSLHTLRVLNGYPWTCNRRCRVIVDLGSHGALTTLELAQVDIALRTLPPTLTELTVRFSTLVEPPTAVPPTTLESLSVVHCPDGHERGRWYAQSIDASRHTLKSIKYSQPVSPELGLVLAKGEFPHLTSVDIPDCPDQLLWQPIPSVTRLTLNCNHGQVYYYLTRLELTKFWWNSEVPECPHLVEFKAAKVFIDDDVAMLPLPKVTVFDMSWMMAGSAPFSWDLVHLPRHLRRLRLRSMRLRQFPMDKFDHIGSIDMSDNLLEEIGDIDASEINIERNPLSRLTLSTAQKVVVDNVTTATFSPQLTSLSIDVTKLSSWQSLAGVTNLHHLHLRCGSAKWSTIDVKSFSRPSQASSPSRLAATLPQTLESLHIEAEAVDDRQLQFEPGCQLSELRMQCDEFGRFPLPPHVQKLHVECGVFRLRPDYPRGLTQLSISTWFDRAGPRIIGDNPQIFFAQFHQLQSLILRGCNIEMADSPLVLPATLHQLRIEAFQVQAVRLQFDPPGPTELQSLTIRNCYIEVPVRKCSLNFADLGHNQRSQHAKLTHFDTDEIPEGEFPESLVAVHSGYGRHADYLNPRYIGRG
ncbi:hypothetical protein DIURU_003924 [Diutina rugosa]|uniref:Uncharacterized protein n=1 Tax=Diutina rugosa TaxID=5481 RepID=A0A642UNH6_DIURU|nr:uncharacterized protein DIURU_003924 [Diutina rugosa]KAA8900108.1 hypothetical protein DIURU_003924 [Diutina rugosa]